MDLLNIYKKLESKIRLIDFNALWDGFHPFPFALYIKEKACLNSEIFSKPDCFYGCTAIKYKNQLIAIWNMEFDPIEDIDFLTANLIHEMFHCYQLEVGENRFPNDLELMFSPMTIEHCNLRYQDSMLLCQAYKMPSLALLQRICFVRNEMLKNAPIATIQELKAETVEGMAEYVSVKGLKVLSKTKYFNRMEKACTELMSVSLQLNPRRRSYNSGVLFYHLLDVLCIHFKDFTGMTIFHNINKQIPSKLYSIQSNPLLNQSITKQEQDNKLLIQDFIAKSHYNEFSSQIIGYDPVNMIQQENFIFCKGYLKLTNGKEEREFYQPILLKVFRENTIQVLGYYIQNIK